MKTFAQLVNEQLDAVTEVFPWDVEERLGKGDAPMLLDIREESEFSAMRIAGSLNVPRGILESACEYDYEETVKELVEARDREIVIICRSGNRSVLAAVTMQMMGYNRVASLKTGLRGWNDYELELVDAAGIKVNIDQADEYFTTHLRPDQMSPG
jgi:rhodanese-related sulfurtransferase